MLWEPLGSIAEALTLNKKFPETACMKQPDAHMLYCLNVCLQQSECFPLLKVLFCTARETNRDLSDFTIERESGRREWVTFLHYFFMGCFMQIVSFSLTFEITSLMKSEELKVFLYLEIQPLGIKDDKAEGLPINEVVGRITYFFLSFIR